MTYLGLRSFRALPVALFLHLCACSGESGDPPAETTDAGTDATEESDTSAPPDSDTGTTDTGPREPACGDGIVDDAETCDDGNTTTETACDYGEAFCDRCNADCSESLFLEGNTCGDGDLDAENEVCDRDDLGGATCSELVPESVGGTPRCAFDCQSVVTDGCRLAICGDGVVEGDEACDDGNVQTETTCEAGTAECTACNADCSQELALVGPSCGDGNVDFGEVCDDGNTVTEDSCDYGVESCEVCAADCLDVLSRTGAFCGDGETNGPEACDDAGRPVPEACPYGTASCTACQMDCSETVELTGRVCGDGVIDDAFEVCDGEELGGATCESLDAEFVGGDLLCNDACNGFVTTACEGRPCGNGVLDDDEVCDDGNIETEVACAYGEATCSACIADCTEELELTGAFCGDGVRDAAEVCDSGGADAPLACVYGVSLCDVCREDCGGFDTIEGPYCGDGVVDAEETCDEGELNGELGSCSPWSCNALTEHIAPPPEFIGGDEWGYRISVNDRWLVVGQPFEEPEGTSRMGGMYVFERVGGGLVFSQRIEPPTSRRFSGFANEIHVVGDEILTACSECGSGGALLVYTFDGVEWTRAQTVSPSSGFGAGNIAALSDDLVVLIDPFFSIDEYIGIPWVIERQDDGTWGEAQRLVPSIPEAYPNCGAAIGNDEVMIGSCEYNDRQGVLLVFEKTESGWAETQMLESGPVDGEYPDTLSYFGRDLTYVGDDLVVAGVSGLERPDGSGWMVAFERGDDGFEVIDGPRVDERGRPQGVGQILLGTENRVAVGFTRRLDEVSRPEVSFFERLDDRWVLVGEVRHSVSRVFSDAEHFDAWDGRFYVGSPYSDAYGESAGVVWVY